MDRITSYEQIEALRAAGELTTAEETLLQECQVGRPTQLEDGTRPEAPSDARNVHAELLRYLIKGGCAGCRVDENGVMLQGAYVIGPLDLGFVTAQGQTMLVSCTFEKELYATHARLELLALNDSRCEGLDAQGIRVTGHILLRGAFSSRGTVYLAGSEIGGQLVCSGGQIENAGGMALNAQGATVAESVVLDDGFSAIGEVSLSGAEIGGQLNCSGGNFVNEMGDALNAQRLKITESVFLRKGFSAKGQVSFSGAHIGGQLDCSESRLDNQGNVAFLAKNLSCSEFYWCQVEHFAGRLSLTGAKIGDFSDDMESWDKVGEFKLNGVQIGTLHGPTDVTERLAWLEKGASADGEFTPQPFEAFAKVLREMGHGGDARRVQRAKEDLLAADRLKRSREKLTLLRAQRDAETRPEAFHAIQRRMPRLWYEVTVMRWWSFFLKHLIGYGYAPQFALGWAGLIITGSALFYLFVWNFGGMVPNSEVILTSEAWREILAQEPKQIGAAWEASAIGQHYETFAAMTYAADVFIPLIDFGQQRAWTATTATKLGTVAWAMTWVLEGFGWLVTALGAAAITGIIRRE